MSEYIPTDTDISEIGDYQDDYKELLMRNGALSSELDYIKKQFNDELFEKENKIQNLIFENDKLKSSLESANTLLNFYQSDDNSKYKKINEQLSSKNFEFEQINHSLKRDNFSIKCEVEELKNEIEKIKSNKNKEQLEFSVFSTNQGTKLLETEENFINSPTKENFFNFIDKEKYINKDFDIPVFALNQEKRNKGNKELTDLNTFKRKSLSSNNKIEINIDCEKYMINERLSEKDFESNLDDENLNLNSSDDSLIEMHKMNLTELKFYSRKVKKESKEFYKKALDMLTENEFEIMKLKSENEQLKEYNEKFEKENVLPKHKMQRNSIISENGEIKYQSESEEYNNFIEEIESLKKQLNGKTNEYEYEKQKLNQALEGLENNHKIVISDYENEIYKLKFEIENLEIEKNILEKDLNRDYNDKNSMAQDLEKYNQIIRNLEEQKDKSDSNSRHIVDSLNIEKKKLEKINLELNEKSEKFEREIKIMKDNENKIMKEASDNFKKEKQILEREIIELRGNYNLLTKEKEILKKELEQAKVNHKNMKIQINDLTTDYKKIKEEKIDEIKKINQKYEENIEDLNHQFFEEKLKLQEKIKELYNIIEENGLNSRNSDSLHNIETKITPINNLNIINQDGDAQNKSKDSIFNLSKEIENLKSKNFKFTVEINALNNKLKVKENKIANTIRLKTEIDTLKKEKLKYKSDMLELKKLYEDQINELISQLDEVTKKKDKETTHKVLENTNKENVCHKENIDELKETILKLNYEKRFYNDQVVILNKELENMERVKNEYIKKLKIDLEQTEEIAVRAKISVAQIVFEKDTELVKYKKYCKKLKTKLQGNISLNNGSVTTREQNNGNLNNKCIDTANNVPNECRKSLFDRLFNK